MLKKKQKLLANILSACLNSQVSKSSICLSVSLNCRSSSSSSYIALTSLELSITEYDLLNSKYRYFPTIMAILDSLWLLLHTASDYRIPSAQVHHGAMHFYCCNRKLLVKRKLMSEYARLCYEGMT